MIARTSPAATRMHLTMPISPTFRTMIERITAAAALATAIPAALHGQQVEFIAHRGESADAPENTLASVNLAWERGVEAVEIDVHLTADDRLVVIHDANTRRTAGVDRVVRESTLADLHGLDVGSWKGARWAGEPLPTLEEVLATVPNGRTLFIEVKVGAEAIPALERAIQLHARDAAQLVMISFQADAVEASKRRMPEMPSYYLSGFRGDSASGEWTPAVDELIATAREIGADGLDVSVNGPVDAEFVRRVRDAGMRTYIYTVNDEPTARRLVEAGVDGITSDRAAALRREIYPGSAAPDAGKD